VGVDAKGCTQLRLEPHSSPLLICPSNTTCFEDGFTAPEETGLSTATYPTFVRWKGSLFLLYREGFHDCGSLHVAFLNENDRWQAGGTPLMTGTDAIWTSGPYINTPVVSHDGRLHLFVVWRLSENSTSAGQVVNVGLDYLCSDDGLQTLHTLNGIRLTQPITPSISERVICVPIGSSLINQSTASVLSGNRPAALTYWDTGDGIPQYRLCWHDHWQ
jgi:hypothetical protein